MPGHGRQRGRPWEPAGGGSQQNWDRQTERNTDIYIHEFQTGARRSIIRIKLRLNLILKRNIAERDDCFINSGSILFTGGVKMYIFTYMCKEIKY